MPLGQCIIGQNPGLVAKPLAGVGQGLYPGACKFVGYNALVGKGLCMGLGLGTGMGILGPLLLIGAGIAGGYFFFKSKKEKDASD
jgi:hypothetical protein